MKYIVLIFFFWFSGIYQMYGGLPEFGFEIEEIYVQASNNISIKLNNVDANDIELKLTNGVSRKLNDSTYHVIPQMPTEDFKIKLYYKKIICDLMTVKAIMLEKPKIIIPGTENGTISKANLNSFLNLKLNQSHRVPINLQYKIRSYNMTLIDPNGIGVFNKNCQSMDFDTEVLQKLHNLNVGAKIQINNIFVIDSSNSMSRLPQSINLEVIR